MSEGNKEFGLGLGLGATKAGRHKTERPEKIEPKESESQHRTMPDDQILVKPTRRLTQKDTPKTVQSQVDTHTAMKQIATLENKKMYEVLNEVVEHYIKDMPSQNKKLVIDSVRAVQQNMKSL